MKVKDDAGGDYGYDLAHELKAVLALPTSRRRRAPSGRRAGRSSCTATSATTRPTNADPRTTDQPAAAITSAASTCSACAAVRPVFAR